MNSKYGTDSNITKKGEQQLSDYLDRFHLKKGYLLTFNFNRKKESGIKYVPFGDKVFLEGMV